MTASPAVSHLDVVADAVGAAHLEEDAVVNDREVRVVELRAHDGVTVRVHRLIVLFLLPAHPYTQYC